MGFRSIVIEGGDQIGKGDVTHYLLRSFSDKKINIFKISFPMYSTPFGYIVRKTLKNGFSEVKDVKDIIGTKREIELRMIIYALNRHEALESILRHLGNKDVYFLLDRSPYSSALTISYGLGGLKSIKKNEVRDLVKLGLSFEQPFINTLNTEECVLHLMADFGETGWKRSRTDGDLYEVKGIQEVADDVYAEIASIVGKGWNRIYTKENGEFRNRIDIYKEVDKVVDALSYNSEENGSGSIYDVLKVAEDVYNVKLSNLESYKRYFKNIEEDSNEKNKETYELACEIAQYTVKNCDNVIFKNKEVKNNAKKLLDLYPEIFMLLNYYFGNEFTQKLKEGIYE